MPRIDGLRIGLLPYWRCAVALARLALKQLAMLVAVGVALLLAAGAVVIALAIAA